MTLSEEQRKTLVWLEIFMEHIKIVLAVFFQVWFMLKQRRRLGNTYGCRYSLTGRLTGQIRHLNDLVGVSDVICRNNLRMPIHLFNHLNNLLETVGGLTDTKNVSVREQVAMFLSILSHHQKNRVIQTTFNRSGYTVSKHFKRVLIALLRCGSVLLVNPQPIPDGSNDFRWKHFKDCLGALDGTYIAVRVPETDKGRFRNRKGVVSTNVLAVCDKNMNFVHVVTGWEGSAADSRVLRDAVTRPNGFKVPTGQFYLVDSGYTNGEGFLAPYRGVRYHLRDFDSGSLAPQNYKELYNMRHAKARNVIERAFGILKSRWAILRSPSFYPVKQQNWIILACCLLHNFISLNIDRDPEEDNVPDLVDNGEIDDDDVDEPDAQFIQTVEASTAWTNFRETVAIDMYATYLSS